jgi:predicted RNA-binding Zn ribbon-like protein
MRFEFLAGHLALDFANTVHNWGAPDPEDDLKGFSDLVSWARQAGVVNEQESRELHRSSQANPAAAASDLKRALRLRGLIYEVFSGIAQGARPHPGALAGLNSYCKQAMAQVSIQRVGDRYELGWEQGNRIFDRVLWAVTRSVTDLMTSEGLERVRQCAGESCSWLFLDTSRNGLRRWCDMQACGNRAKVRRFRQRQVEAARPSTSKLTRTARS